MELLLQRQTLTSQSTIGSLAIDGIWSCYTLEDCVRLTGPKITGATAIPAGRYRVVIDFSQRFQRRMLHVLDVPDFDGIRIHAGNTQQDTRGCILVGQTKALDAIHGSFTALTILQHQVETALASGDDCWITITNPDSINHPLTEAA